MADDAAREILGERRAVGQHKLDMRFERFPRDRLRRLRQRMIDADDGEHIDRGEKIGCEISRAGGRRREDRELRHALAQALLGSAQALGEDRDRHIGELFAQRLEARDQRLMRENRVYGEHELRLDLVCDAGRASLERQDAFEKAAGILGERGAGRGQAGRFRRAVEQGDAQVSFERGDRLADRRLHAPELSRRRRKAAFVGDCDQHAQLIQGERVDHGRSSALLSTERLGYSRILPVVMTVRPRGIALGRLSRRLFSSGRRAGNSRISSQGPPGPRRDCRAASPEPSGASRNRLPEGG